MKKLILTIIDGDEKTNIALEIDGMTLPEAIGRLEIEKAALVQKALAQKKGATEQEIVPVMEVQP